MPCSFRIASIFAFAFADDVGDDEVLVGRQDEAAGMHLGDLAQRRAQRPAGHILDAAVLDEQRQVPLLVGALRASR